MQNMYAGIANSPGAVLNNDVSAAATIIPVSDVSAFPAAPSRATIGTDENAETIIYAAKTANALSGCTRGVEGVAQDWVAGTPIARNFTNGDYAALTGNITELAEDMDAHTAATSNPHGVTKSQVGLGNVDNTSDANKPVSTAAAAALAAKAPLNLSAGFTPAATLANPAAGDSVETALSRIAKRLGTFTPNISAVSWKKLFDIVPITGYSAITGCLIIGHDGTVDARSNADPICLHVIAATHNNGQLPYVRAQKLSPSQYSRYAMQIGYVIDENNKVTVYLKTQSSGGLLIIPLSGRGYIGRDTWYDDAMITTEPAGIVYVEPTTYAPEKLSSGFAPAATLSNLAAGDTIETAITKLNDFGYHLYQFPAAATSSFAWIKLHSVGISTESVNAVSFDVIGSAHANFGTKMEGFVSIQRLAGNTNAIRHKLFYPYRESSDVTNTAYTDIGYILDKSTNTWRFEVWIRCARYASSFLSKAMFNNISPVYPDVTTRTTTEPDGIVYVEPTTYAPTASPTFTGVPTAPTPAAASNDTSIATTAFVNNSISTLTASVTALQAQNAWLTEYAQYFREITDWLYNAVGALANEVGYIFVPRVFVPPDPPPTTTD